MPLLREVLIVSIKSRVDVPPAGMYFSNCSPKLPNSSAEPYGVSLAESKKLIRDDLVYFIRNNSISG